MIDKYSREIDYLRISLTDKCNLKCIYCMPNNAVDSNYNNNDLTLENYKFIIKQFSKLGIKKVRFTGGEPLVYPYLDDIIEYTKNECEIDDICITTNAIGLVDKIENLKEKGLKKVNISIDSLDKNKYKRITRGGNLEEVLKSLNKCIEIGIKVKINCVLIKGLNDNEMYDFIELTKKDPIDVRFIELMPLGEGMDIFEKGYINLQEVFKGIKGLNHVEDVDKSVASYYKLENYKGRVGMITPMSCSFCSNCNRVRITSNGNLKLCLHSEDELDIKPYLTDKYIFLELMKKNIYLKPEKHKMVENKKSDTKRKMYQIGG